MYSCFRKLRGQGGGRSVETGCGDVLGWLCSGRWARVTSSWKPCILMAFWAAALPMSCHLPGQLSFWTPCFSALGGQGSGSSPSSRHFQTRVGWGKEIAFGSGAGFSQNCSFVCRFLPVWLTEEMVPGGSGKLWHTHAQPSHTRWQLFPLGGSPCRLLHWMEWPGIPDDKGRECFWALKWCSRCYAKHFAWITSFNSHNGPVR